MHERLTSKENTNNQARQGFNSPENSSFVPEKMMNHIIDKVKLSKITKHPPSFTKIIGEVVKEYEGDEKKMDKFVNIFLDFLKKELDNTLSREELVNFREGKTYEFMEKSIADTIFDHLICKELEGVMIDALAEKGVNNKISENFSQSLKKLSVEERKNILSWPGDMLRSDNKDHFLFKEINKLKKTKNVSKFIQNLLSYFSEKDSRTIGYHISQQNIRPGERGWWVDAKGEEKAYYSLSYENIYREGLTKDGDNYLYIVRGSTKDPSVNENGRWFKAHGLDILHRVSFDKFDNETLDCYADLIINSLKSAN